MADKCSKVTEEITPRQILEVDNALKSVADFKLSELPAELRTKWASGCRAFDHWAEPIRKALSDTGEEYAKRNGDGEPMRMGGGYIIDPKRRKKYDDEVERMLDDEADELTFFAFESSVVIDVVPLSGPAYNALLEAGVVTGDEDVDLLALNESKANGKAPDAKQKAEKKTAKAKK